MRREWVERRDAKVALERREWVERRDAKVALAEAGVGGTQGRRDAKVALAEAGVGGNARAQGRKDRSGGGGSG